MLFSFLLVCCIAFTTVGGSVVYAASGNYDVTPPVYEGLTFAQQGQTVSVSDKLQVKVQCYDAESEIEKMYIGYGQSSEWGGWLGSGRWFSNGEFTYDDKTNTAEITFSLGSWYLEEMQLCEVCITDTNGNQTRISLTDKSYKCKVSDYTERPSNETQFVDLPVTLETDKKVISGEGDKICITVILPEDTHIALEDGTKVKGQMGCRGDASYTEEYDLTFDYEKQVFRGEIMWKSRMLNGENSLWYSTPDFGIGNVRYLMNCSYYDTRYVTVENATDPAVSLKAEYVKNSELTQENFYTAGDTVRYSIPAEGRQKDYPIARIELKGIADTTRYKNVELNYNAKTDCYEGVFDITDKIYPCEWRVERIVFYTDAAPSDYFNVYVREASYLDDMNYYFSVMQQNTFSAATGSVWRVS